MGSDHRDQALIEEIVRAGGTMRMAPVDLRRRLGMRESPVADDYSRYAVKRRLERAGITFAEEEPGVIRLTAASPTPRLALAQARPQPASASRSTPAPRPASAVARAQPARARNPAPAKAAPQPASAKPAVQQQQPAVAPPRATSTSAATAAADSPAGPHDQPAWRGFYAVAAAVANLVPAIAYELSPSGELEGRGLTFVTVYLTTLPFSLGLTLAILIQMRDWISDGHQRLGATLALFVGASVVCGYFGSSQADIAILSQVHGNVLMVLGQLAFYLVFSYAYYYGIVMFVAAIIASWAAAMWVNDRLA